MTRTRTCPCGADFSYQVGSGTDRKYCTAKCRIAANIASARKRQANAAACSTAGCGKRSNSARGGLCEACYCYAWRTGKARDPKRKPYKIGTTTHGYRKLRVPGHPLADSNQAVFHHRLVAYATHNGICPPCYWCGIPLAWEGTHIDHLNEQRVDNRPENLVVACPTCNRARGSMLPFFRSLSPERFDELWRLMALQLTKKSEVA